MKIGIVIPRIGLGQSSNFSHHYFLAEQLSKKNEVSLIATNPGPSFAGGNLQVSSLPSKLRMPLLLANIRLQRYDVINSHVHYKPLELMLLSRSKHTRYGFTAGGLQDSFPVRKIPLCLLKGKKFQKFFSVANREFVWLYDYYNPEKARFAIWSGGPRFISCPSELPKPSIMSRIAAKSYFATLKRSDYVVVYSKRLLSAKRDIRSSDTNVDHFLKSVQGGYPLDLGIEKNRVFVVPNFVQYERLQQIPGSRKVETDGLRLVYVGRLTNRKGLDFVLRAIADLKAMEKIKNISLKIIGDGESYSYLRYLACYWKIEDQVQFLGVLPNSAVYSYLMSSDVFVLCSTNEGMSRSTLEAMACGLPVISTGVGGMPDIVLNKRTGMLIETDSVRSIQDAILYFLDNPTRRFSMGAAAKKLVFLNHSITTASRNYQKVYDQVMR